MTESVSHPHTGQDVQSFLSVSTQGLGPLWEGRGAGAASRLRAPTLHCLPPGLAGCQAAVSNFCCSQESPRRLVRNANFSAPPSEFPLQVGAEAQRSTSAGGFLSAAVTGWTL